MSLQWQAKGSLKGPKGDAGEKGERGAQGASIRTASIDITDNSDVAIDQISPATGVAVGDLIIDLGGALYSVASVSEGSTVHVASVLAPNLKGPKGDTGAKGADGKDGTGVTILGSYEDEEKLTEAHPTGEPGDAYLVDGDLYVWDAAQTKWKNVGTIQGPKGDAGERGPKGDAGDKGEKGERGQAGPGVSVGSGAPVAPGVEGECYLDIETGNFYKYENAG